MFRSLLRKPKTILLTINKTWDGYLTDTSKMITLIVGFFICILISEKFVLIVFIITIVQRMTYFLYMIFKKDKFKEVKNKCPKK